MPKFKKLTTKKTLPMEKIKEKVQERVKRELKNEDMVLTPYSNLGDEYMTHKSIQKKYKKIKEISKGALTEQQISKIIPMTVPPVIKGISADNIFNMKVITFIKSINFNKKIYEVKDNTLYPNSIGAEVPDWSICNKLNNKKMDGYNKRNMWDTNINKNYDLIVNNTNNTDNMKIVYVVADEVTFSWNNSKKLTMFQFGFENDTLCYLGGLLRIINNFFNLNLQ